MMNTRLRSSLVAVTVGLSLTLAISACGSERAGAGASSKATTAAPKPGQSKAPVTYTVTGGIAGVKQTVVVDVSGKATVTDARKARFTCTVVPSVLSQVQSRAQSLVGAQPQPKALSKPTAAGADFFNYTLKVGDKTYSVVGGAKIPEEIRPLMASMHDVLTSAQALRDHQKQPNGSASCTA